MYLGEIIKQFRQQHNMSMGDFAKISGISKAYVSVLERNKDPRNGKIITPSIHIIKKVSEATDIPFDDIFNQLDDDIIVSLDEIEIKKENTSQILSDIINTSAQLEEERQKNVLNYATEQLEEQNTNKTNDIISIKEDTTEYKHKPLTPITVIECLAAGVGYLYDETNETDTVYTDRDDFRTYDVASYVSGDSMEPVYNNGDVVLIKNGYDNVNGDVYAVDFDGKTFLKRVYNDGGQFRLVSYNDKYEDILIDIPVDSDIYFNILGKVVDSFSPLDKYGELL